jgi:predicted transposase YdaD
MEGIESIKSILRTMLKNGMEIELVSKMTGLSIEEINIYR